MGKLTTHMRESIARSVLVHRFGEAAKAIVAERAAFAVKVYEDLYNENDRRKMRSLPKGWLPSEASLSVQFGDGRNYDVMNFNGAVFGEVASALSEAIPVVFLPIIAAHRHGCAKAYEPSHPFVAEYVALKERTEALRLEIRAARKQAEAAINSASTVGRLVEAWPEIEPFAVKFEAKPAQLPAVPTRELNALFKLPVSEAA